MTTQRWREIDRVFEAVSDCPVSERDALLRQECAGDDDLRRDVDALLACDADDDAFAENRPPPRAWRVRRQPPWSGTDSGRIGLPVPSATTVWERSMKAFGRVKTTNSA